MGFWEGKRVLVTGGSGLIGGYLCRALVDAGADATVYDLQAGGTLTMHGLSRKILPRISGDIMNLDMLRNSIQEQDFVFHLAANSGVEESRTIGYDAFMVNIVGTLNVLEACRSNPILQAVVCTTSNHVYGEQKPGMVYEDAKLNQLDTYSASKICADYLARAYAHNYKTPSVIVRNTNCYGPYDPHIKHIIPGTILSLLNGEAAVIRLDGRTIKSYLYTSDVADGLMLAAKWTAESGRYGEVFNLSGERISVLELVTMIQRLCNLGLMPIILGEIHDQHDEHLSTKKAESVLGWRPQVALSDGLSRTIDWFLESLLQP
jgi:CDP-glucose 4,6-dehydratase